MPATVKGAVLSWAAMTSSFLRINASPMPHLPPQAEFQAREWVKETGTRCATAAQNRQIWKHDYLPVIVSIFVVACIVPQYSSVKDPHQLAEEEKKIQDLPAEWGNTRREGKKQQAGWRV